MRTFVLGVLFVEMFFLHKNSISSIGYRSIQIFCVILCQFWYFANKCLFYLSSNNYLLRVLQAFWIFKFVFCYTCEIIFKYIFNLVTSLLLGLWLHLHYVVWYWWHKSLRHCSFFISFVSILFMLDQYSRSLIVFSSTVFWY